MSLLFVGESPPPGAPPNFEPFDCTSGDRLATLGLGLKSRRELLDHVPRVNIFDEPGVGAPGGPKWNRTAAAKSGESILGGFGPFVALGRDVARALGIDGEPSWCSWHRIGGRDIIACSHPSGRSPVLHTLQGRATTRRALIPEVVAGCPGLRPWHFNLDNPDILADLGAAVSPFDPALGVAALRVADEVWRAKASPDPYLELESYRHIVNRPLQFLPRACVMHKQRLVDAWSGIPRIATELRSRAKAAAPMFKDYPVEVLRATIGRYVALELV